MKWLKLTGTGAVALMAGLFTGIGSSAIDSERHELTLPAPALGTAVQAGRAHVHRTARRTSRRTTRRTVRRLTVLPAGCAWRAPYHYCGGVYYQQVTEGGSTYYIVINP